MADPKSAHDLQPIGLTVYDLPQPEASTPDETVRTRHGRLKLFFIFLACAAPILLSYFTYYVVRPEGRRSQGELIEPQRLIPELRATALNGSAVALPQLKGQWLLVTVGAGACAADCERLLFVQRQLHKLLNKERDRVDRVWFITDAATPSAELQQAIEGTTVLRLPEAELATWFTPASGRALADHLYLVDPQGHWMMRFGPTYDAQSVSGIKRDLERLLRASSSWDQPGR
jgi:hypothetical protein